MVVRLVNLIREGNMKPLTVKENKRLTILDKKVKSGRATRSELGTAFNLKQRKNKAGVVGSSFHVEDK